MIQVSLIANHSYSRQQMDTSYQCVFEQLGLPVESRLQKDDLPDLLLKLLEY